MIVPSLACNLGRVGLESLHLLEFLLVVGTDKVVFVLDLCVVSIVLLDVGKNDSSRDGTVWQGVVEKVWDFSISINDSIKSISNGLCLGNESKLDLDIVYFVVFEDKLVGSVSFFGQGVSIIVEGKTGQSCRSDRIENRRTAKAAAARVPEAAAVSSLS